jgi:hypothetical protein
MSQFQTPMCLEPFNAFDVDGLFDANVAGACIDGEGCVSPALLSSAAFLTFVNTFLPHWQQIKQFESVAISDTVLAYNEVRTIKVSGKTGMGELVRVDLERPLQGRMSVNIKLDCLFSVDVSDYVV